MFSGMMDIFPGLQPNISKRSAINLNGFLN